MCIAIIKDNNKRLDTEILIKSAIINPHGLGVVWLDTGKLEFFQSDDWSYLDTNRPYIAHFRYATVGAVNKENCHPFKIEGTNCYLFQNGTVYGLGNKNKTDTQHLADILSRSHEDDWEYILEMNDSRFIIWDEKMNEYEVYNEQMWIEKDDVLYSKRNVLEGSLVSVYGTLRPGHGNNGLLRGAKHLGTGKTQNKFLLSASGVPFVSPRKGLAGSNHVTVDTYIVDDKEFADLDMLESHPQWYMRQKTNVVLGGSLIRTWLYFNDDIGQEIIPTGDYDDYRTPSYTTNHYYGDYNYQGSTYNMNDEWNCPKCNQTEIIYDDSVGLDWCYSCADYIKYDDWFPEDDKDLIYQNELV